MIPAGMIISMARIHRYRWLTIRYADPSELRLEDPEKVLVQYMRKWGSNDDPPADMMRNAEITLNNKLSEKAQYDWNARVDLDTGLVQIPQLNFDVANKGDRFMLDRQGLTKADDGKGMTIPELKQMIKSSLLDWADIQLKYSAGGIATALKLRASRGRRGHRIKE